MLNILFLIAGLAILIIGANLMVDGASSIARKLNVSDMVIGLTIVSMGTSAPELTISIVAAINGNTEIVIGNVIGSNIFNILLILGISAAIFPLIVQNNTQYKEIPFSLFAALLVIILANDIFIDKAEVNIISRIDGLVLLCFFMFFLYYIFQIARKSDVVVERKKKLSPVKSVLYIVLGLAGLVFGGKYFVEGGIGVAHKN
jgi:cation:H+ antiporter